MVEEGGILGRTREKREEENIRERRGSFDLNSHLLSLSFFLIPCREVLTRNWTSTRQHDVSRFSLSKFEPKKVDLKKKKRKKA